MLSSGLRSTRIQRRSVFWLVSLFALVGAHGQPADVAGTLPEDYLPPLKAILEKAWTQSPRTIEKTLELAISEARIDGLNSERLPRVHLWGNYAANQTAISGETDNRTRDNGFFYTLELSQSLYRWGELKNKSALGRLGVLIAEKNYAEAYRTLVQILRHSYMELVARKMSLKAARFTYQVAVDELKLARSTFERGGISPGDLAGQELTTNEHEVRLAMQEQDFADVLQSFTRLSGAMDLTETAIPDDFPRPTYSSALAKEILAEALRDGGKFSLEAEINALKAREADLNYQIERVRLRPKVDAVAVQSLQNLATAGPNTVVQTGVSTQTVAVRFDWWLFDGYAARGAKREALALREIFERRTRQASEAALERAQQLERRLALDARLLEFSDAKLGIALAGERQRREELELGKTSPVGIANTQAIRLLREAESANARANFLGRWSEFVSLVGLDPVMNQLPARYAREKR
jgi:outer membrane protein TolC